jgi:hypothetical protein
MQTRSTTLAFVFDIDPAVLAYIHHRRRRPGHSFERQLTIILQTRSFCRLYSISPSIAFSPNASVILSKNIVELLPKLV